MWRDVAPNLRCGSGGCVPSAEAEVYDAAISMAGGPRMKARNCYPWVEGVEGTWVVDFFFHIEDNLSEEVAYEVEVFFHTYPLALEVEVGLVCCTFSHTKHHHSSGHTYQIAHIRLYISSFGP